MGDNALSYEQAAAPQSLWKRLAHRRRRHRAFHGRLANLEDLRRNGVRFARPVDQPLILISQIQRSGGTLLSQLFDGHPACYAHPHELKIGYPDKFTWPALDVRESPDRLFDRLFEDKHIKLMRVGYSKGRGDSAIPFCFIPSLQRDIFINVLSHVQAPTERDIFNAYFTSYFNAWLDLQHKYAEKQIITGFVAGLSLFPAQMDRYFAVYPDGCLLAVVRHPADWYASAKRLKSKAHIFGDAASAARWWRHSIDALLTIKQHYGEKVVLLDFCRLVSDTPSVMQGLCARLGIAYDEVLNQPTFNTVPIGANTSFAIDTQGVSKDVIDRKSTLSSEERLGIDPCIPLYDRALRMVEF